METSKPQEQFISNVEEFVCSICLEVPSPLTCLEHEECAHLFCCSCFDAYKKSNNKGSVVCPYCKTDQGLFRAVKEKSKFIYRQMCSLKIRCDNYQYTKTTPIKIKAVGTAPPTPEPLPTTSSDAMPVPVSSPMQRTQSSSSSPPSSPAFLLTNSSQGDALPTLCTPSEVLPKTTSEPILSKSEVVSTSLLSSSLSSSIISSSILSSSLSSSLSSLPLSNSTVSTPTPTTTTTTTTTTDSDCCVDVMEWSLLGVHMNECKYGLGVCRWKCNTVVQRRCLEEHEMQCELRCVKCAYCSQTIKHVDESEHHRTKCDKCPWTVVACQYKEHGCVKRFAREEEEQHNNEFMAYHLSLIKQAYDKLLERTRETRYEYVFNTKEEIQKTDFITSGGKWEVIFYPKGNKAGKGTHLSIYLRLVSASIPKIRVRFSFSVLMKNGQWTKLEAVHELSVGGDWGWHKFVGLTECPNDVVFVTTTMHQIEFVVD